MKLEEVPVALKCVLPPVLVEIFKEYNCNFVRHEAGTSLKTTSVSPLVIVCVDDDEEDKSLNELAVF